MAANRGQTFIVLAVVLGAAAAVAAYSSFNTLASQAAGRDKKNFKPVVVTATDLTYGMKLEQPMLKVVRYPKDAVPAGAFSSIDSVMGQTTKVFMSAREPITATKLSSRGGGLSMLVRPTMRAASIEVNQVSGVSGFVLPGDRVDVLVTIDPRGGSGNEAASTHTILQNVEVLAAGQKTQQQDNKPITVQAVTLLVDPSGAEQVAHAQHEGEITLVLRNPEDQDNVTVASVSTREMMGKTPATTTPVARATSRPAAKPAAPTQVQVAERQSRFGRKEEEVKVRMIRNAAVTETPAVSDTIRKD
jgi:pilus assembly protein CpaB